MEIVREKNVATRITFPLVDADGDAVSSAGSLDSEYTTWGDGSNPGSFSDCTNEATEIDSSGVYYLQLSQGEMNNDYIYVQIKSTSAKTQHILIRTMTGDPLNFATSTSGRLIDVESGGTVGVDFDNINGTLDAAEIGADAITSSELAASAANEIRDAILSDSTAFAGANIDQALSTTESNIRGADSDDLKAISDEIAGLNDPSSSSVADAVWNEAKTGHTGDLKTIADNVDQALSTTESNIRGADSDDLKAISDEIAGLNDLSTADVNGEVDTALSDIGLDHLVSSSVAGADITDNSIVAYLVSKEATADWDDFDNTTDSLQAIRDRGDAEWVTGGGGTAAQVADAVWDEAIADHTSADTFGAKNQKVVPSETANDYKANVSNLDQAISTTESNIRGADSDTLKSLSDQLDGFNDITAADAADAVWNEAKTGHTGDLKTMADNLDQTISTTESNIRGTDSDDLKAISDEIAGLNDPSSSSVADAVWNEAKTGHTGDLKTIADNVDQALSTTESNIRGADSDSLEDISDEIADAQSDITRILSLNRENTVIESTFNADHEHTGSTIYCYDSKANANTHDGSTGLLYTYTVSVSYTDDDPEEITMVKE